MLFSRPTCVKYRFSSILLFAFASSGMAARSITTFCSVCPVGLAALYQHAKDIGTTLLTITHRPSLWKHHTHLLQFDGCGECKLTELDVHTRLSYRDEKEQLREKIAQFPALKKRFQHLVCPSLGWGLS